MKKLNAKLKRSSTVSSPSLNKLFLFFLFALASPALVFSVPPPEGSSFSLPSACKINPDAVAKRASALKAAPFFPAPLAATTAYVLVIRVDFADRPMSKTLAETQAFFDQMKSFYHENSYGLLTVSATVTNGGAGAQGSYRLSQNLTVYAQGICSNYDLIAKHSLSAADADVNLSNGAPGGNRFNHIMIYHAGLGAETTGDNGCQTDNIWSVFAPTVPASASQSDGIRMDVAFAADGVAFNGATMVPESEAGGIDPLGVICHEYGHQLGLPDLYRTPSASAVGKWSLMDSGVYLGSPAGSNPSHLDAWSKLFLGFSRPQTVPLGAGQNVFLDFAASSANAFVRIPVAANEYFLIERRGNSSLTGKVYDNSLPLGGSSQGFVVWHIDDGIASNEARLAANNVNNGSPYFAVDLVEADGAGGGTTPTNGKDSDFFPGSKGKTLFATPLSNDFAGNQTGATVSDFLSSTLFVKFAVGAPVLEIAKVVNFPNPGGPGYAQRTGSPSGTFTTLVLNTSRPALELKLTIHNLAGRLVKNVTPGLIRANGNAISNNKFVYEYDWDGKDDDGETVPAGVYLYRFKADGKEHKSGKLVLIR